MLRNSMNYLWVWNNAQEVICVHQISVIEVKKWKYLHLGASEAEEKLGCMVETLGGCEGKQHRFNFKLKKIVLI